MQASIVLVLSLLGLGAQIQGELTLAGIPQGAEQASATPSREWVLEGWIARAEDNIVGLRDPRTLSNPAKVDFEGLMESTAEIRKLHRDRIDPGSPEGIQLKTRARARIAEACEQVISRRGLCSVWKQISHSDGRAVTDVTEDVRELL